MSVQPSRTTACATCGRIFLQITVAGSDQTAIFAGAFALICRTTFDLPRDIDQRIVRRLIAIRRRIRGGPLNVRIVIGRSRAQVQNFHTEFAAKLHEFHWLRQIEFQRIILIRAERDRDTAAENPPECPAQVCLVALGPDRV